MNAVGFLKGFDACVCHGAPLYLTDEAKDHYERIKKLAAAKGISEKAAYEQWKNRDGLLVSGNTLFQLRQEFT